MDRFEFALSQRVPDENVMMGTGARQETTVFAESEAACSRVMIRRQELAGGEIPREFVSLVESCLGRLNR